MGFASGQRPRRRSGGLRCVGKTSARMSGATSAGTRATRERCVERRGTSAEIGAGKRGGQIAGTDAAIGTTAGTSAGRSPDSSAGRTVEKNPDMTLGALGATTASMNVGNTEVMSSDGRHVRTIGGSQCTRMRRRSVRATAVVSAAAPDKYVGLDVRQWIWPSHGQGMADSQIRSTATDYVLTSAWLFLGHSEASAMSARHLLGHSKEMSTPFAAPDQ